ncbi:putative polyprotein [Tanacetum coccineum]
MKGGIRIEGDEITIYKNVTKIKTSNQTKIAEISELEVSEEEFLEINESIYFNQEGSREFQEQFKPVIDSCYGMRNQSHGLGILRSQEGLYGMVGYASWFEKCPSSFFNKMDNASKELRIHSLHECMEGWGGIVKWKKRKEDPRSSERICAYASGKFSTTQSTIDAEINACINTLEKLKIYYSYTIQDVSLRTDCQAIISFYNKTNSNKSSRVRWIKFADAVTGTGIKINIEHIERKHNTLADSLSRLVNLCFAECTGEMKELAAVALYSVEEFALRDIDFQQQKEAVKKPCESLKQEYNANSPNMLWTINNDNTSHDTEKMFEFKTKKTGESSWNGKLALRLGTHNNIITTQKMTQSKTMASTTTTGKDF